VRAQNEIVAAFTIHQKKYDADKTL